MSTNRRNRACLVCMIGFVAFSELGGKEPRVKSQLVTIAECERLVEQLANPDPPPFQEDYVLKLPKGVTTAALAKSQKPIAAAYDALSKNIEVSVPVLIAHMDDERYSHVYEVGPSAVFQRRSVGECCAIIAFKHIDVYQTAVTRQDAEGRRRALSFIDEACGGFENWWKERHEKNLAELQLEGLDWAFGHVRPPYFTPQEWDAAQQKLRSLAAQIRETGKAIPVENRLRFFSR